MQRKEDMRNILEVDFRERLLPGEGGQGYLGSGIKLKEGGGVANSYIGSCWVESKPELGME